MNLELNKSIEAKRLNKRTGAPTADPEVPIPYGAIVENVESVGDFDRFMYLREMYRCTHTLLASATDPKAWRAQSAPASASVELPASEPAPAKPSLKWTVVESRQVPMLRAKVPGGWLLAAPSGNGLTFYPDPIHHWDGTSLD